MEATLFRVFHKPESRRRIELSPVKFPAAIQAGHLPFDPADSRKIFAASGTAIQETPDTLPDWKRQSVTARFVRDAEVAAGLSPFSAVWRDAATPGSELREQMGQLVAQGALDFRGVVVAESRVERDEITPRIGAAGRAEKARIPFDANFRCEFGGVDRGENFARRRFEGRIASQDDEHRRRRENKIQLLWPRLFVRLQGTAI